MTRILITGSRDWTNHALIVRELTAQYMETPDAILVSGGCPSGADRFCEEIWVNLGGTIEVHPADWTLGRGAGILRNQQMVDLGADVCFAFRKNYSRGTTHCANAATMAGIPTYWFTEDEEDE